MAKLSQTCYSDTYDKCPKCGGQMYEDYRVVVCGDGTIPDQMIGDRYCDEIYCAECGYMPHQSGDD